MKRTTAILLCILLCAILLISGCQKAAQKPAPKSTPQVQQTSDSEKRVMASRFSNLATSVNGVQKATVVVSSTDSATPGNTDVGLTPPASQLPPNAPNALKPKPNNVPGSDTSGLSTPSGEIAPATTGKMVVMVGLNLDSKAMQDKTREQSIKEEVKSKIKGNDNRISDVLVTTNPDMIKKLQDVAAGVIQGKPMQSFAQDINELDKNIRAGK